MSNRHNKKRRSLRLQSRVKPNFLDVPEPPELSSKDKPPKRYKTVESINRHLIKLGFQVRKSGLDRDGMFCKTSAIIPANTYLGDYIGVYRHCNLTNYIDSDYIMQAEKGVSVDAKESLHMFRSLNDDLTKNPDFLDLKARVDGKEIMIYTNIDINPTKYHWKEVFISYGMEYWYPVRINKLNNTQLIGFNNWYGNRVPHDKEYENKVTEAKRQQNNNNQKKYDQMRIARQVNRKRISVSKMKKNKKGSPY
jgi:hypothetical protein